MQCPAPKRCSPPRSLRMMQLALAGRCHATLRTSQGTGPRIMDNPNPFTTGCASAGRYAPSWVDPGAIRRSGAARHRAVAAAPRTTHAVTPRTMGRLRCASAAPRDCFSPSSSDTPYARPNAAGGALAEGRTFSGPVPPNSTIGAMAAHAPPSPPYPPPVPMCRRAVRYPAPRPRHPRTRCRSPTSATRNPGLPPRLHPFEAFL